MRCLRPYTFRRGALFACSPHYDVHWQAGVPTCCVGTVVVAPDAKRQDGIYNGAAKVSNDERRHTRRQPRRPC